VISKEELLELQGRLQYLKDWPVGGYSAPSEVGHKWIASIELSLKIAELLLRDLDRGV